MNIESDIYTINDELIKTLTNEQKIIDISKEFNLADDTADKIDLVIRILLEYNRIPQIELQKQKNDTISETLRKSGNQHYSQKYYFDALLAYNESICFAKHYSDTSSSEHLSISYANRSAIYFDLELYDVCLINIQLAKDAGYPQRLMAKINKREADCWEFMKKRKSQKRTMPPIELSHLPHSKVPYISNCLELKESPANGRYIVTNTELLPGQIVALENSFINILLPKYRYQKCANCLQENQLTLIPCDTCTSAMFCSQDCMEKAKKNFHQFECPFIDYLYAIFNKIHLCAIRTTIRAFLCFASVDQLIAFVNNVDEKQINVFTVDNSISAEENYLPIHTLATNQEFRSTADLFQRAVIAGVAYYQLIRVTPFREMLVTDEAKLTLKRLLFRHLQTSPTNFHSLDMIKVGGEEESYCSGAYPFCSLLNHSCDPNIVRISYGTTIAIYILRTIKIGEELLDNYGFHHCLQEKLQRRSSLKFQYNFICKCRACENDYPLYADLQTKIELPKIIDENEMFMISQMNKKIARKNLKTFFNYLTKYNEHYPCAQLSLVQENMKMCLNILADKESFQSKCLRGKMS